MRKSQITRKTGETDIQLDLLIDGTGQGEIVTGIGFFDHMLNLFTKHGLFDLRIRAAGDLQVDDHHTVEDVGIVLGQAIKEALGTKESIRRYGTSYVPMDEALAFVSLDLSGRPLLVYGAGYSAERVGDFSTEMVEEFFRAVANNCGMNIHIRMMAGTNAHHMIEAIFKAFGRALDEATSIDSRIQGILSTKGSL